MKKSATRSAAKRSLPKTLPISVQLKKAVQKAGTAKTKAHVAKTALKKAKRAFKLARRTAKVARKEVKALEEAIKRTDGKPATTKELSRVPAKPKSRAPIKRKRVRRTSKAVAPVQQGADVSQAETQSNSNGVPDALPQTSPKVPDDSAFPPAPHA